MSDDTRTLNQLAIEALAAQNACNLSGVAHGFSRAITRLRALLEASGKGGTDAVNTHPICVLWVDKMASLTGDRYSEAYETVQRLATDNDDRLITVA